MSIPNEPLVPGDMVHFVWACCGPNRELLMGRTGTVLELGQVPPTSFLKCTRCGYTFPGGTPTALLDIDDWGARWTVRSWIKKIDPPAKTEHTETEEEAHA